MTPGEEFLFHSSQPFEQNTYPHGLVRYVGPTLADTRYPNVRVEYVNPSGKMFGTTFYALERELSPVDA